MILRKYMSLMGIGSAQVDLIIDKNRYRRAEMVNGRIHIIGGTVEQQIKRIECDFVKTNPIMETEEIIDSVTILTKQQIDSGEKSHFEFHFQLSDDLEKTSQSSSYHFKTKLIFNEGVKSLDHDPIFIVD